mmetsp:Transcript_130154/g.417687  ORF Transcript_130154/g.417687 Transcript_130154/m.417687 type:complete len:151 (-) Transcript_130154:86-538(-)
MAAQFLTDAVVSMTPLPLAGGSLACPPPSPSRPFRHSRKAALMPVLLVAAALFAALGLFCWPLTAEDGAAAAAFDEGARHTSTDADASRDRFESANGDEDPSEQNIADEGVDESSDNEAMSLITVFVAGILTKCTAKFLKSNQIVWAFAA